MIINPRSGYGGSRHALGEFRAAAKDLGLNVVEYTTSAPQDATVYAQSIADDASAVLVWGGDGTVNEVAHGLAGTDVAILPCHAGTENLLAKDLRIPRSPRRIIGVLRTGQVVSCDVGKINGKSFLLIVGVGFDGEVVQRLDTFRTGHISQLSYFWPIWRTFWEHRFPRMHLRADGEDVFDGRGLAFVGNIARYATGLRICRDAHFDDGMLDLVVFACHRRTELIFHAMRTVIGLHRSHPRALYRHFKHLTIETDR
ncbi:MAG: hypothetical protein J7M14_02405, partial [Planctomycetes bacterium]|nr:hypothetical protein [Planctomycetota bacterium]